MSKFLLVNKQHFYRTSKKHFYYLFQENLILFDWAIIAVYMKGQDKWISAIFVKVKNEGKIADYNLSFRCNKNE